MSKTDDELLHIRILSILNGNFKSMAADKLLQLITDRDAERELQVWKEVRRSYPKKATLQGRAVSKLTLADIDRKITELEAIRRKEEL